MSHPCAGAYRPTDFFETSAMLITFILLGKYLEAAAKGRTSDAITKLMQLTPATAILLEASCTPPRPAPPFMRLKLVTRAILLGTGCMPPSALNARHPTPPAAHT